MYPILLVRAYELGYSAKAIGSGAQLGKFILKQGIHPVGKVVSYVKQGIQLQCIETTTGQAIEATIEQAVAQEPSPANWFKSVDIKKLMFGG